MKFLAILRDSLRETIDSKVFLVVAVISALPLLVMATLSLQPKPADEGFRNISQRFYDGSQEVELPLLGKIKATPSFTEYSIQELKTPEGAARPWEAEYEFIIEARDLIPHGTRLAILRQQFMKEDQQERAEKTGRKTRGQEIREEFGEEARRIQEKYKTRPTDPQGQQQLLDQLMAFLIKRLENELNRVSVAEMEQFFRAQLEDQANWRVAEVKMLDLPPQEKKIKIKARVPVQEGEDVRLKTEEVEGELNKFVVKIVSRAGTYRVWPHKATLFFGAIPLGSSVQPGQMVYRIIHYLIGWFGGPVIMLLSCIITAFFIPNMLRKGSIDLLLAKPISRVSLLTYKYVGGLAFIFLLTTVLVLGLWLVLGLRTSIWEPAFLYIILVLTFEFALFYSLSTLVAVWTRSPVACILVCVLTWTVLWITGWAYWFAVCKPELKEEIPQWAATTANVVHAALPHYLDLDWLSDKEIWGQMLSLSQGERDKLEWTGYLSLRWPESLLVTSLYIIVFLGLACWRFAVKDY